MANSAAEFWETRYTDSSRVWSGRVNPVLADTTSELTPGRALDLGCGEGGDALYLAKQGWTVTGVDLSPTAIKRGRAAAAKVGIPELSIRFEVADLAAWNSTEHYDLVTASFLQAWQVEFPRDDILRRATGFVAPGGHLLVTSHAAAPPWADLKEASGRSFPTPEGDLAALALNPSQWQVLACEYRDREATSPDGTRCSLTDTVVLVHRVREPRSK